jgi:hypothetical protein
LALLQNIDVGSDEVSELGMLQWRTATCRDVEKLWLVGTTDRDIAQVITGTQQGLHQQSTQQSFYGALCSLYSICVSNDAVQIVHS